MCNMLFEPLSNVNDGKGLMGKSKRLKREAL